MKETHSRSVLKGISWRFFATLDTIVISTFVTGAFGYAVTIGMAEVITKVFIFYLHERLWQRIAAKNGMSRSRSFIKATSWRLVGTMDTILLSYLITGHGIWALKIGGVEFVTKILLYYLHERAWLKVAYGKKIEEQMETGAIPDANR